MRSFALGLILMLGAVSSAPGQDTEVQAFSGPKPLTSGTFTVQDRWEVRWATVDPVSIAVFSADGKLVTGAAGSGKGSLYEPQGGTFYVQVTPHVPDSASVWNVSVVQLGPTAAAASTEAQSLYFMPPDVAPAPTPAPATVPDKLTDQQAMAIVLIKGDAGEGTGFLVKMSDGPAVITNLHVLAANPNVHITTSTGGEIKPLGLKGASDRDLALLPIADNHYSYLDLASNLDTVSIGDPVLTPGDSEGGEVMLDTKGDVLGVGPDRVEISNPVYHGNSGGPVFHLGSGKVIAVVTEAKLVRMLNAVDKASFSSSKSAISGSMRYFGLRPDTVPKWEPYDWGQFLTQTTFLRNFHLQSRYLDSYLNGARDEQAHLTSPGDEDGPPDSRFFLRNDNVRQVSETLHQMSSADKSERMDAQRQALMTLDGFADADLAAIQDMNNFYGFEQTRAQQELKYRKALRTELDTIESKLSDEGH